MGRIVMGLPTVMATGSRKVQYPTVVRAGITHAYTHGGYELAITGGAEGADTIAAEVADELGLPFDVYLPNWAYRLNYREAIGPALLDRARQVVYVVDRPVAADWRERWGAERWWKDNFARNTAMGGAATEAVVVSARHPVELLDSNVSGGTANCVRRLVALGYESVWWVPDAPDVRHGVERVALTVQTSLFGGR